MTEERAFWSVQTHSDDLSRPYGDVLGSVYSYTSRVPNHKQIKPGDVLIVRDEAHALGVGTVNEVVNRPAELDYEVCPGCQKSRIYRRSKKQPPYRCLNCDKEFDAPERRSENGLRYEAFYAAGWEVLDKPIPKKDIQSLYAKGAGQNAIHRLDPEKAAGFIEKEATLGFTNDLFAQTVAEEGPEHSADEPDIRGGRRQMLTNLRIGQNKFREALIAKYGERCAITGDYPASGLEVAHIVSFAERQEHKTGDGFLLRADLHRLFDAKQLAVDTSGDSWTVVLSPELRRHPTVKELHGRKLAVSVRLRPRAEALDDHLRACRRAWSSVTAQQ